MTEVDTEDDLTVHNAFVYNPETGDLVVALASFSEVAVVADTVNAWNGNFDKKWNPESGIIANADQLAQFGQLVSDGNNFKDKTIKLTCDINIGGIENYNDNKVIFYPIGYHKAGTEENKAGETEWYGYGGEFSGTFDGAGHTISGIYHNTWAMDGNYDNGYYNAAMGLFGYISGGTVKNLTIHDFYSEGEFAPTGCITAYADGTSTFENIAITNSHPQTYNTGVAGIVGWDNGGDTEAEASNFTFRNITIDESNTVSALWGSWDVAAAGLMGYLGEHSKAILDNCHVAATIDVYNDVCGNYQYYWYRYCGMMIGTVDKTKSDGSLDLSNITATNCTVNFGDRHEYYYCEYVKNSIASYTHDYQFSRVDNADITVDANGKATCNHDHAARGTEIINGEEVLVEDKQAVYIPFRQVFGGYGWGVDGKELDELLDVQDITKGEIEKSVAKFEVKFPNTADYLYRVGNANTVTLGTLFKAKDGVEINNSGVVVSIDKLDDATNVSGTYTANTSDWTQGTIKFTGTGPVKLTIQDYNYCNPTELYVEVVDATNVTAYSGLGNRNSVLLNDITMSSGGSYYLSDATLYGNGFTFDVTDGAYSGTGSISNNYLICLSNANLDNIKITGYVYTSYGAQVKDNYNRPVVLSSGNNTITNSYISNCAAPVRVNGGNLEIIKSTLKGGNFANLDIRNGHVILDNVTTINQVNGNDTAKDGTVVVGLGVVVYYENVLNTTTVEVKNGITQYNYLSKSQASTYIKDQTAQTLTNAMFDNDYSGVQHNDGNDTWVNVGILSMTSSVGDDNISDVDGYVEAYPSMTGVTGYLHTKKPDATSIAATAPAYTTVGQGAIAPSYSFDYTTKNYVAKTDGSNDYCYEENGTVYIAMDDGDTFNWDTSILTAIKNGQTLGYTVSMNGVDYTGKSIAFNTAGDYTVTYTYTDSNNFGVDENGNITTYDKTYTKAVHITVSVIKATTKHAEFTFGSSNQSTEKITVGNNTYISAVGVSHDNSTWSYITVDGTKIYYPIVEATIVDKKIAYFNVFKNIVTITDYADGGTGTAVTYNSSTITMPSGLTVVKGIYKEFDKISSNWSTLNDTALTLLGASNVFKYAGSASASATPTTYSGALCFASPEVTNSRNEYITMVQYSYTDATNTTYYYYVGYHMAKKDDGNCIASGTLITLADGTQKPIEEITFEDELLVWDFFNGEYTTSVPTLLADNGEQIYRVITLKFDDGSAIRITTAHGFIDTATNEYVFISEDNAKDYIGHSFVKADGDYYTTVKLVDYTVTEEFTNTYHILTAVHNNCITDGLISVTNSPIDGNFYDYFEVGEGLKYDEEAMQRDIKKYGLYTYEDLAEYVTYEQFIAFNGPYLKVLVGKEICTFEQIVELIGIFLGN